MTNAEIDVPGEPHWRHVKTSLAGEMDEHGAWVCPDCTRLRDSARGHDFAVHLPGERDDCQGCA